MGIPEQVWFLGDLGESLGAVAPHSPPQPGCLVGARSLCRGHRGDSGRGLSPRRWREPRLLSQHWPWTRQGAARGHGWQKP